MLPRATPGRATTQPLAVLVTVVATLVVVGVTWVFVGGVGGQVPDPAATAAVDVEGANLDDGVAHNDAVVLVHEGGETVDRGVLRVTVGNDTVFVRDLSGDGSGGLVRDVDGDGVDDLADPGTRVRTGPRAADQWYGDVTSGERLVVRERRDGRATDVIERGETVRVVVVGESGERFVVVEERL
jgi:hypothetical protein